MQIRQEQERDSVRFVWNVMPSSRLLQARVAVPQALHYSPLQQREGSLLGHPPPQCSNCEAFMNPYNRIHFSKTAYTCCICKASNPLPHNYLAGDSYPPEIGLNFSSFLRTERTAEGSRKQGYLFVVDTCLEKKQLEAVKEAVIQLVDSLEDDCPVGLITFNKFATVHDLASRTAKSLSFSPLQEYELPDFAKSLDLRTSEGNANIDKYLTILGNCRQSFVRRVSALRKIKHVGYKHQREARATGLALNLAISLNEMTPVPSKIVLFCGGPCTVGSGKVIEQDYKQEMRGIREELPALAKTAKEFYAKLAQRARGKLIPIDSFLFSVEGLGLDEMNELLTATGGLLVLHEEFSSSVFKESFRKAYMGLEGFPPLERATSGSIQIKCSREIVFTRDSSEMRQAKGSEALIVLGDLDEWRTVSVGFELAEVSTDAEAFYMQIRTSYYYPENINIRFQRITTVRRLFASFPGDLAQGFDQGAATAFLAKLAAARPREHSPQELRHWLDNTLCKWAEMLGEFRRGDAESFKLRDCLKAFPQFVYHLRRNAVVRRSGLSLDEFVYICSTVKRQSVQNLVLIIQPALLRYSAEQQSMRPVALDERFLKAESVLLLDSFFNVVQWRGSLIAETVAQGLHREGEHSYVGRILDNVERDAESLKYDRFPVPHYYLTGAGQSKERFIKSRLGSREQEQQEGNLSDEVDVGVFTEKLIELVVNKQP